MLQPGTLVDGRYLLRGPLGAGGMATVHAAWDTRLEVPVALKVLQLPIAAIAARLVQEGRIQAALRHPNIVSVTDIVTVAGAPGLVMELVQGPSLADLLAARELDLLEAEHLARGVLAGVQAAHALGLVHRDLKPANVLVDRLGELLHPKVADFGLARLLEGEGQGTRSGMAMGTPRYMAPEQIRAARDVDACADVFSLGAVLYELFSGQQAFPGDDTVALFNAICSGERQPPSVHRELPERIEAVVLACLQVAPEDRPQSVAEVLERLGPAPEPRYRPETLDAHQRLAGGPLAELSAPPDDSVRRAESAAPSGVASETFGWAEASTASSSASVAPSASETFGWDVAPSAPAAPAAAPPPPEPAQEVGPEPRGSPRRRGPVLLGLVLLVALLLALAWPALRPEAVQAFTPEAAPAIEGSPAQQRLLDQAWAEYQANEDLDAMGHLDEALASGAADPAVHLLRAAVALGFGDWDTVTAQVAAGAELARGPGPVSDLLLALHAGLEQDSDLSWWAPTLEAHTARHPEDWLAWVLWSAGMFAAPEQVPYEDAVVQAVMDTNPGAVGSWVVGLELRRAHGQLDAAHEAGRRGLSLHPGSAALRGSFARVLVERGELEAAMAEVVECLRRDPAWTPCRTTGAGLAVRTGDDAALERLALPLSGPEADPARVYRFSHGVAQALEGHGRPGAAEEFWTRTLAAAREADNPTGALAAHSARVRYAWSPLRATEAVLEARLRALDQALADPDLPRRARQEPGWTSQVSHALLALRRGESADLDPSELEGVHGARLAWERARAAGQAPPADADCLVLAEHIAEASAALAEAARPRAEAACATAQTWDQGAWAGVQVLRGWAGSEVFEAAWPAAEGDVPLVARLRTEAATGEDAAEGEPGPAGRYELPR